MAEMRSEMRNIQERNEQLKLSVATLQDKTCALLEKDSSLQDELQRLSSRFSERQQSLAQLESSSGKDLEEREKQISDRRKQKEVIHEDIRRFCSRLGCAETASGIGEAAKGLQERESMLEEDEAKRRTQLQTMEAKRTEQLQQQRLLERELKELMEENARPVDVTSVAEIRSVDVDG